MKIQLSRTRDIRNFLNSKFYKTFGYLRIMCPLFQDTITEFRRQSLIKVLHIFNTENLGTCID
jgi:hypothetical protein